MYKKLTIFLSALYLFSAAKVLAVCPVCTIAVGVGVGLTRKYGIDDTISGIWVGALLVSTSMWTINWLNSKKWSFWGMNYIIPGVLYAITLIPMYQKNIISQKILGDHYQSLWGIDKLLLGILFGSFAFLLAVSTYEYFKKKNGKPHFPFEKVALPITVLVLISIVFYFITR